MYLLIKIFSYLFYRLLMLRKKIIFYIFLRRIFKNLYLIFFWPKEFTCVKHGEKAQCLASVFPLYFEFNGLLSHSVGIFFWHVLWISIQITKDLDENNFLVNHSYYTLT